MGFAQSRGLAVMLLVTLAGCGGGGAPSVPSGSPSSPPVMAIVDDWTTYAHDFQRTGFEQLPTGITPTTVGQLALAWRANPDAPCAAAAQSAQVFADEASPLAANGLVYVADVCGVVSALNRDTGAVVWQTSLPLDAGPVSGVYGTPTLADGLLFVPVWGAAGTVSSPATAHGGYLAALDASSGSIVWTAPTPPLTYGNMRGEPAVVNGRVYEGISGGDPYTGSVTGGIAAFNEMTGQQAVNTFPVVPGCAFAAPCQGGGSWSPISYDGSKLYFGTGNAVNNTGYQDSVLALDPSTLALLDTIAGTYDGASDDEDVGGGELIWGGNIYFEGKTGNYYGYSLATGQPVFSKTLVNRNTSPGGIGAIWTPTTDGSVIAVSSGYDICTVQGGCYGSYLDLFPVGGGGTPKCSLHATNSTLFSYAAFVPGIGFSVLDNGVAPGTPTTAPNPPQPWVVAFDDDCNILWKANPTDVLGYFYAGPVVVESGLYAVDDVGNVYAWKLPSRMSASLYRQRADLIRPAGRQHMLFGHFVPGHYPPHLY